MATQAQIKANRINSQKSTGPSEGVRTPSDRTPEGKARSAQNALRHGVRAEAILSAQFQVLGEDPEDFAALLHALVEDLKPQGPVEEMCVENIALGLWRQRRILRAELGNIAARQANLTDQDDPAAQAGVGVPELDLLRTLMRYESHLHRQIHYGFTKLTQVQTLRYMKATRDRLGYEPRVPHGFKDEITTALYDTYAASGTANGRQAAQAPEDQAAASEQTPPTSSASDQTNPIPPSPSLSGQTDQVPGIPSPLPAEAEPAEQTHSPATGPEACRDGEEATELESAPPLSDPVARARTNPIRQSPDPFTASLPLTREILDKKLALQHRSNGKRH